MLVDSIQDSTRYVVGTLHQGSILPGTRQELVRDVFLNENADVRGGIWCGALSVSGTNINVQGSVYCLGAASIDVEGDNPVSGDITFRACFTSADSLLIRRSPSKVRFFSDIYTDRLNLSNAFVYGNVHANDAVIRDSVILGGIFCDNNLTIENSFFSTFNVRHADIGRGSSMFLTYASASEGIELREPVQLLTFYSISRQLGGNTGDVVLLDQHDVLTVNVDDILDRDDDDGTDEVQKIFCLSLMERVLDSAVLQEHLEYNKKFLGALSMRHNLTPEAQSRYFPGSLKELESVLWTVQSGNVKLSNERNSTDLAKFMDRFGTDSD